MIFFFQISEEKTKASVSNTLINPKRQWLLALGSHVFAARLSGVQSCHRFGHPCEL
jgi:hypothetical protein